MRRDDDPIMDVEQAASNRRLGGTSRALMGGVSALVCLPAVIVSTEGVAGAHPFPSPPCSAVYGVTRPRLNGLTFTYNISAVSTPGSTAITQASAGHAADTDIAAWNPVTTGGTVVWNYLNDPDTSLAGFSGVTWLTADANPPSCTIVSHTDYINLPHITVDLNARNTVGEKQCIAAHELGHSEGLSHSNQTAAATGLAEHAAADTIMRGGEHNGRCHVAAPPGRYRAADVTDINAKY
jgi:hypothetical protein